MYQAYRTVHLSSWKRSKNHYDRLLSLLLRGGSISWEGWSGILTSEGGVYKVLGSIVKVMIERIKKELVNGDKELSLVYKIKPRLEKFYILTLFIL